MKPTRWNDALFNKYKNEEIERLTAALKKFVHTVIGKENGDFDSIKFVVDNGISTENNIITFAEKNKTGFICIAT
jgi:hypothetical protein